MRFEIDRERDGLLIREFMRQYLGMSGSLIKHIKFSETGILVNGERKNVRYTLREGDVLDLALEDTPEEVSPYIVPAPLPLETVFEDPYLTVVNKPFDMPSHPSRGHALDTVANALAYRYQGEVYVFRPVNRLDRDTSGLMMVARTRIAAFQASCLMKSGRVHKVYLAVLDGYFPLNTGKHRSYIRRACETELNREECDAHAPGGKIALTAFRVLARKNGKTLVLASPLTGRTHQLRVHFSSMGCPVEGDVMYGKESRFIGRQALHAITLELPHPVTGEPMKWAAPVPADMRALITECFGTEAETLWKKAEHSFYSDVFGKENAGDE